MTIAQKTVAAGIAIGTMAFTPQIANAQSFAAKQINPFSLVDVSNQSTPTFADLDGDGDYDMLSGSDNITYNYSTYSFEYQFQYFENVGTATNPVFAAPQANPFGITSPNTDGELAPTFVDLDGDGDMDIVYGNYYTPIFYFLENTGTATNPAFAPAQANPFGLTDFDGSSSYSSALSFADLDNDGDLDMITGEYYGEFYYFENTGTANVPAFAAPVNNPFGLYYLSGMSAPAFIDMDNDGDFDLISGEGDGDFYYFENTGTASAPAFASYQVNPFNLTFVGSDPNYSSDYSKPTFVDLDNDGDIDLMAGDGYGDFNYYRRCLPSTSTISPVSVCSYTSPSGQYLTASGTYTDVIQNSTGCDSVITINLTINSMLDQSFVSTSPVICGNPGSTNINLVSSQPGVSYYLRDNSNDTIVDGPIMGTGSGISFNTGVISNPTTYNVYAEKQVNSKGLVFGGGSEKVSCGNSSSVQLSGTQITLEAWIYPTSWVGVNQGHIINKEFNGGLGSDYGYMVRCGDNGKINFNLGNGNWNELTTTTTPLVLNAWQHVAATYDGSEMKVYVDGNLIQSQSTSISFSAPNNDLTIGSWAGGLGSTFDGKIDEARVWSVAKTQSEIQASMNSCLTGSETGLAAYYQFEDGAGSSTLTDISPNGNNGTLQNMDVNTAWGLGTAICATCNLEMSQTVSVTFGSAVDGTVNNTLSPTLSANQAGATYQWVDCNNSNAPIAGETAQTFTATASGSYAVEVTFNGCTVTSACETISLTGVDALSNNNVSIYPNPTNGIVNINLGGNNSLVDYFITTIEGRVVESGRTSANMIEVDLSKEGNGIYFLRINSEKTSTVHKLIKQ